MNYWQSIWFRPSETLRYVFSNNLIIPFYTMVSYILATSIVPIVLEYAAFKYNIGGFRESLVQDLLTESSNIAYEEAVILLERVFVLGGVTTIPFLLIWFLYYVLHVKAFEKTALERGLDSSIAKIRNLVALSLIPWIVSLTIGLIYTVYATMISADVYNYYVLNIVLWLVGVILGLWSFSVKLKMIETWYGFKFWQTIKFMLVVGFRTFLYLIVPIILLSMIMLGLTKDFLMPYGLGY